MKSIGCIIQQGGFRSFYPGDLDWSKGESNSRLNSWGKIDLLSMLR